MIDWNKIIELTDQHEYMSGIDRETYRLKQTAEVFTPTWLVIDVIKNLGIEKFKSGETILDPACGDGQFLVPIKWIKIIHFKMSEKDALSELYGLDIMKDNIDLCKKRLINGNLNLLEIVNKNIVCANALTYNYKFDNDDETIFNKLFIT
jgi:type I restriction-modification system DNA methylase subunit